MKRFIAGCCVAALGPFSGLAAAEKNLNIGIVNFAKCIESSKHGQHEQKQFETIKLQIQKSMQDQEQELTTTTGKLQDKDFMDSLSPEAEKELKVKYQAQAEDLQRSQSQYYQIMQQANMRLMHTIADLINEASSAVAKKAHLSLVLNKDAAFHFADTLDITEEVIKEMDNKFAKDEKAAQVETTAAKK
jgi:outer membrane protein